METIGKVVSVLSNQVHKLNNKAFKSLNISHSEAITLFRLKENENIYLDNLSHLMSIDKSATTRLIKGLEEKGYVTKHVASDDRRKYCLNLTESGNNLIPKIQSIFNNNSKVLLSGISDAEEQLFRALVEKMIHNARSEYNER